MPKPLELIEEHSRAGCRARKDFFDKNSQQLQGASLQLALAIARGHKLLVCGNGNDAEARYVAAQFINNFIFDRPALPAIPLEHCLSAGPAAGMASEQEFCFARQVDALGRPGDVFFVISSCACNIGLLNALITAKEKGLFVLGLGCPESGAMISYCDIFLNVDCENRPVIKELHMAAEHALCRLVEHHLFENVGILAPYLRPDE